MKLYARYGNQWSSQWGSDEIVKMAHAEWYEELKHCNQGDIKRGLDTYRGEYPPNLMQFAKACKRPATNLAHQEYVQIAPIATSREDAKRNLDRLRSLISGSGVTSPVVARKPIVKDDAYFEMKKKMEGLEGE